jgi:hypothetical protein
MPEQFLLDFDVGTHSTQQARVGMPKGVPANLADAGTHGGGFDAPSQNALLPAWLPLAVRKYPVAGFSVPAPLPVCPEGIGQTRINGKRKPRGFRLSIADSSVDNTSPHQQREVLPIKIAPLQADDFACPKTETGRNQNHSVVRLSKFSEDHAHVMYAQHSRDRSAPAALPYEINGVDVAYLPPPSMLEHKMQKAPQVYL